VALPGCELVVELDVSATKGDPSGMTPAEVIRAVHVGKSGAEVVTDLSSISCPSECSGAPMNVPDADAAQLEELMKKADDLPKGGWYKVPFTPGLIEEIAGLQGKVRGSGPPASA